MINLLLFAATDAIVQDSTLTNIMENTLNTALNTQFGIIAKISFIAALVSAFFAVGSFIIGWRTMKAQESTENSTKGGKNVPSTQNLMLDMVRHLYRNLVVTYAIIERMRQKKFKVYPSELHLKKMEVNLNNIDLHIFLDNPEDYIALSRLYDILRNYHYELEVTNTHLKDSELDIDSKQRDLSNLIFKCDYLTRQIIETLTKIWPNSNRNFLVEAKNTILYYQNLQMSEGHNEEQLTNFRLEALEPGLYYLSVLFADDEGPFLEGFYNDVRVELGKDQIGRDRIHMIDL